MIKDTGCGKVDVQVKGSWPTPAPDEELDKILEGYYRWCMETILKSFSLPEIGGFGHQPPLKPSAAKSQILAYVDKRERLAREDELGRICWPWMHTPWTAKQYEEYIDNRMETLDTSKEGSDE